MKRFLLFLTLALVMMIPVSSYAIPLSDEANLFTVDIPNSTYYYTTAETTMPDDILQAFLADNEGTDIRLYALYEMPDGRTGYSYKITVASGQEEIQAFGASEDILQANDITDWPEEIRQDVMSAAMSPYQNDYNYTAPQNIPFGGVNSMLLHGAGKEDVNNISDIYMSLVGGNIVTSVLIYQDENPYNAEVQAIPSTMTFNLSYSADANTAGGAKVVLDDGSNPSSVYGDDNATGSGSGIFSGFSNPLSQYQSDPYFLLYVILFLSGVAVAIFLIIFFINKRKNRRVPNQPQPSPRQKQKYTKVRAQERQEASGETVFVRQSTNNRDNTATPAAAGYASRTAGNAPLTRQQYRAMKAQKVQAPSAEADLPAEEILPDMNTARNDYAPPVRDTYTETQDQGYRMPSQPQVHEEPAPSSFRYAQSDPYANAYTRKPALVEPAYEKPVRHTHEEPRRQYTDEPYYDEAPQYHKPARDSMHSGYPERQHYPDEHFDTPDQKYPYNDRNIDPYPAAEYDVPENPYSSYREFRDSLQNPEQLPYDELPHIDAPHTSSYGNSYDAYLDAPSSHVEDNVHSTRTGGNTVEPPSTGHPFDDDNYRNHLEKYFAQPDESVDDISKNTQPNFPRDYFETLMSNDPRYAQLAADKKRNETQSPVLDRPYDAPPHLEDDRRYDMRHSYASNDSTDSTDRRPQQDDYYGYGAYDNSGNQLQQGDHYSRDRRDRKPPQGDYYGHAPHGSRDRQLPQDNYYGYGYDPRRQPQQSDYYGHDFRGSRDRQPPQDDYYGHNPRRDREPQADDSYSYDHRGSRDMQLQPEDYYSHDPSGNRDRSPQQGDYYGYDHRGSRDMQLQPEDYYGHDPRDIRDRLPQQGEGDYYAHDPRGSRGSRPQPDDYYGHDRAECIQPTDYKEELSSSQDRNAPQSSEQYDPDYQPPQQPEHKPVGSRKDRHKDNRS